MDTLKDICSRVAITKENLYDKAEMIYLVYLGKYGLKEIIKEMQNILEAK